MTEPEEQSKQAEPPAGGPALHVAPGPHLRDRPFTARRMMVDVIIALLPPTIAALVIFKQYAAVQIAVCVGGCCGAEALLSYIRWRRVTLGDWSAVVTGLILALSMPAVAPLFSGGVFAATPQIVVSLIGACAAIGLGKFIFGGLGYNIFNPAMVGRAFVMLAFTSMMGAVSGYQADGTAVDVLSQATPMTAVKEDGVVTGLAALFWGNTNGSLGETSALACLAGGLFLCIRRTASWQIPLGMLAAAGIVTGTQNLLDPSADWTVLHGMLGGSMLFGAFFIATDPVTSPLGSRGKFIFGAGVGVLVVIIRNLSAYPEGVMFAVLLMNAVTPLINRWTVPRPFGAAGAKG